MNEVRNLWGLRVLSLVIAMMIWFFVSVEKREPRSERVVEVTVTYNISPGYIILDPVQKVQVRLRGSTSRIRSVNPLMVDAFIEIRNPQVGTTEILLAADQISLPEGIEVVSIDPNLIRVRIDREVTKLLPVEPRLEGEPAAGAIAQDPTVEPAQALVRGPESRLRNAGPLTTTPVDLTGHALDFVEQAAVVSTDPLIKIVEPAVVSVEIPMELPPAGGG